MQSSGAASWRIVRGGRYRAMTAALSGEKVEGVSSVPRMALSGLNYGHAGVNGFRWLSSAQAASAEEANRGRGEVLKSRLLEEEDVAQWKDKPWPTWPKWHLTAVNGSLPFAPKHLAKEQKNHRGNSLQDLVSVMPRAGPNKLGKGMHFYRKLWDSPSRANDIDRLPGRPARNDISLKLYPGEPCYITITRVAPPNHGHGIRIWGIKTWRGVTEDKERQITSLYKRDWKYVKESFEWDYYQGYVKFRGEIESAAAGEGGTEPNQPMDETAAEAAEVVAEAPEGEAASDGSRSG